MHVVHARVRMCCLIDVLYVSYCSVCKVCIHVMRVISAGDLSIVRDVCNACHARGPCDLRVLCDMRRQR